MGPHSDVHSIIYIYYGGRRLIMQQCRLVVTLVLLRVQLKKLDFLQAAQCPSDGAATPAAAARLHGYTYRR